MDQPAVSKARGIGKQWIGYFLAGPALAWVLHGVHFRELVARMAGINWWWIPIAVLFDITGYYCQGWRWKLLLEPRGSISSLRATQGIYAGLFTNEVLPMRFGEVVRAHLVSRWLSVDFLQVVPSMAVERLLDGIVLAAAIALAAIFTPLPPDLVRGAEILGLCVLAGVAAFVYLVVGRPAEVAIQHPGMFRRMVRELGSGLQAIGRSQRRFHTALFFSALKLLFGMLAYWLVMVGFRLHLAIWSGALVFLILTLGTALPNAPANVGTYQFFTVVGLTLFGVDKTTATGFSFVVFLLLTVPLWLLGFFALARSGHTLAQIKQTFNRPRTAPQAA